MITSTLRYSIRYLVDWLLGWLAGWLFGWLVHWLAGWLVVWVVGWLGWGGLGCVGLGWLGLGRVRVLWVAWLVGCLAASALGFVSWLLVAPRSHAPKKSLHQNSPLSESDWGGFYANFFEGASRAS